MAVRSETNYHSTENGAHTVSLPFGYGKDKTMTKKQLERFVRTPIIHDQRTICQMICQLTELPVTKIYNREFQTFEKARKVKFADKVLMQLFVHLGIGSFCRSGSCTEFARTASVEYRPIAEYKVGDLMKRINGMTLDYDTEGWTMYLLSRLYTGYAYDMQCKARLISRSNETDER